MSMTQEFEADAVSARILAHAGFDARKTVDFWERRRAAEVSECSPRSEKWTSDPLELAGCPTRSTLSTTPLPINRSLLDQTDTGADADPVFSSDSEAAGASAGSGRGSGRNFGSSSSQSSIESQDLAYPYAMQSQPLCYYLRQ